VPPGLDRAVGDADDNVFAAPDPQRLIGRRRENRVLPRIVVEREELSSRRVLADVRVDGFDRAAARRDEGRAGDEASQLRHRGARRSRGLLRGIDLRGLDAARAHAQSDRGLHLRVLRARGVDGLPVLRYGDVLLREHLLGEKTLCVELGVAHAIDGRAAQCGLRLDDGRGRVGEPIAVLAAVDLRLRDLLAKSRLALRGRALRRLELRVEIARIERRKHLSGGDVIACVRADIAERLVDRAREAELAVGRDHAGDVQRRRDGAGPCIRGLDGHGLRRRRGGGSRRLQTRACGENDG